MMTNNLGLPYTIAIDFDQTIAETNYPTIIKPRQHVIDKALEMKKNGAKLILWTCRNGAELADACKWCEEHGLVFDAINTNLPERTAYFRSESRKVSADEYWDDRSLNI